MLRRDRNVQLLPKIKESEQYYILCNLAEIKGFARVSLKKIFQLLTVFLKSERSKGVGGQVNLWIFPTLFTKAKAKHQDQNSRGFLMGACQI